MNFTTIGKSPSSNLKRFKAGYITAVAGVALAVSAALAFAPSGWHEVAVAVPSSAAESSASNSAPAIAVIYELAESEGRVPDESLGGFRSPANLRERLQAQRGEFSNALR